MIVNLALHRLEITLKKQTKKNKQTDKQKTKRLYFYGQSHQQSKKSPHMAFTNAWEKFTIVYWLGSKLGFSRSMTQIEVRKPKTSYAEAF